MKIKSKNKVCHQINENVWGNASKILKLKKKKWSLLKKKISQNADHSNQIIKKSPSQKHLYKNRLLVKQLLQSFYGFLPYYKLKYIYNSIEKKNSQQIIDNLIIKLETRLDVLLFRCSFVSTIFQAKQLIKHKNIYVNNRIVLSNNFYLSEGDIIKINNQKIDCEKLPDYIEYNEKLNILIFVKKPKFNQIKFPFNLDKLLLLESLQS